MPRRHFPASQLHVITVISNPVRYESRYRLFQAFVEEMKKADVQLHVVELAFGNRPHQIPESHHYHLIKVRGHDEIWIKENLINIGASKFDWDRLAWIDADVAFEHPEWASETLDQLEHYDMVQLFSNAVDLGPNYEHLNTHTGGMYAYLKGIPYKIGAYGGHWHPGFAWATTRRAFDAVGGLIDTGIAGAGDHHMMLALIGQAERSFPTGLNHSYRAPILRWQALAEQYIKRNVGYVPGLLRHQWHGKKKDRKYWDRWQLLIGPDYRPEINLVKDGQGLNRLIDSVPNYIQLRDGLRGYFRARDEDSIDL